IDLVMALRNASLETWRTRDRAGIDVAAIENMDAGSIGILREDGADIRNGVTFPADTVAALLVQLELPPDLTPADAYDQIGGALTSDAQDGALVRFCRLLSDRDLLDASELALPGDERR